MTGSLARLSLSLWLMCSLPMHVRIQPGSHSLIFVLPSHPSQFCPLRVVPCTFKILTIQAQFSASVAVLSVKLPLSPSCRCCVLLLIRPRMLRFMHYQSSFSLTTAAAWTSAAAAARGRSPQPQQQRKQATWRGTRGPLLPWACCFRFPMLG